jgi:hypothetical protein
VNGPPRSVENTKAESGDCRPQLTQRPNLVAAQRMRGRLAVFGAAHVERGGAAYLAPFEVADLAGAQAVAIRNEDQRRHHDGRSGRCGRRCRALRPRLGVRAQRGQWVAG